jgi:hypothetical protein
MVDAIGALTRLRFLHQEAQSRERWGSAVEIGADGGRDRTADAVTLSAAEAASVLGDDDSRR